MAKSFLVQRAQQKNPHGFLEDLALSNDWRCERPSDNHISIVVENYPCNLTLLSHWDSHSGYLDLVGAFEIDVPHNRKQDVFEVLAALSIDTRLGYFTICPSQGCPLFRHGFLSYPKNPITSHHIADATEEALMGGEKLYQAMRCLLDERKSAQDAVFASLIEVMGEA